MPGPALLSIALSLLITSYASSEHSSTPALDWCDSHCLDKSDTAGQTTHEDNTPPSANFTVIVGCQKCGTTFLHGWLSRHHSVVAASKDGGETGTKELHYLDRAVGRPSYKVYMSYWSHAKDNDKRNNKYMFEASPVYMMTPCAACR